MSSHGPPAATGAFPPPSFGTLLRMALEHVREGMSAAIREAGFADVQAACIGMFSHPLPDGIRPSDLARQNHMTKQALNYHLSRLERLGYIERRAPATGESRRVYLTPRGLQVVRCLAEFEARWSDRVGTERFRTFVDVLWQIDAIE